MQNGCTALRSRFGRGVVMLASLVFLATGSSAAATEPCRLIDKETGKTFRIFEIFGYRNKPDLLTRCVEPVKIWYGKTFWPEGTPRKKDMDLDLPERSLVENAALNSGRYGPITVLDIEHWPIEDETLAQAAVDNYITVLDWFRKAAPKEQAVGYYSMLPIRDYWRALKGPESSKYRSWQEQNDRLAPLAEAVDIVFPSIYTFYDDRDGWLVYAKAQIDESRRLAPDKPVYAFLWPEYHPSNKWRGGDPIDPDYWRIQLDFLREHADGVIIWTIDDTKAIDFAEIPPWWDETVRFIEESFDCKGCT